MTSELSDLYRFLRTNVLLGAVAAIAVLALIGAVVSLAWLGQVQSAREDDRIASDVSSCQRGNRNRDEQAEQIRTAIMGAVEEVAEFAGTDADRKAELQVVVGERLTADVVAIVTKCADVVPGADPGTPDFPDDP